MRAIVLDGYGGPDVLRSAQVPEPIPGPEEVRVSVAATAVNRADILQRQGLYPGPPMDPEILGLEFAGVVEAVGERVSSARLGDRVMGIVAGASYADYVVTHERLLMSVPEILPLEQAAALPEVFVTAYDALVIQGGLGPGGIALVHAGASGVGTAAIQICRALGAKSIVTCSARKTDRCLALGADHAVGYETDDFAAVVKEVTGARGVDVVLDVVGGDYAPRNLRSVRTGGRIVQVGVMGGGPADINLGLLLMKRAAWIGTTLRSRPIEEKIAIVRRCDAEMGDWFGDGTLRPVIDGTVTLEEVQDAHRRIESNETVGKIVLQVR